MTGVLRALKIGMTVVLAANAAGCAALGAAPNIYRPAAFPGAPAPAFIGPARSSGTTTARAEILNTALSLEGFPYVWGGDTPATGFDCSGFIRYVLAQHQMPAPRTAAEQFSLGTRVDFKKLRAGDLVFFSTISPGPSHVGLAVSAEEFVHAPASTGVVRTEQLASPYWRSRFVGARRLLD